MGGVIPILVVALLAGGDVDGDGVAGAADRCPDEPGLASDGCPPRDGDGDGVIDRRDACPLAAGPVANRGCPDADRDGDGVADRLDRCPERPGVAAAAGCAPEDRDGDLVADADDRCPGRAETYNGNRDGDGCPDRGAPRLVVRPAGLELRPPDFARGPLDGAARRALAAAARAARRLGVRRVSVTAVADQGLSVGDSLDRARARAAEVRAVLAGAGLDATVRAEPPDGRPRLLIAPRAGD